MVKMMSTRMSSQLKKTTFYKVQKTLSSQDDGIYIIQEPQTKDSQDSAKDYQYYLKENNNIFGFKLESGTLIGQGRYGQVYKGFWLNYSAPVCIKYQKTPLSHPHYYEKLIRIQSEATICKSVDLGLGYFSINDDIHTHHIQVMRDQGQNLRDYLVNVNPSHDKRYHLAIQACLIIDKLHCGKLSKHQTEPFAHRDIKPSNFTINSKAQLSLIDYGFSNSLFKKVDNIEKGTYLYMPTQQRLNQSVNLAEIDLFALKRTLYLPKSFHYFSSEADSFGNYKDAASAVPDGAMILNPDQVIGTALEPFINTGSSNQYNRLDDNFHSNNDPKFIACLLIAERINLFEQVRRKQQYTKLQNNSEAIDLIIEVYLQNESIPTDNIKQKIKFALNDKDLLKEKGNLIQSSLRAYLKSHPTYSGIFGMFWNLFSIRNAKITLAKSYLQMVENILSSPGSTLVS